jgi:hypothetical protein
VADAELQADVMRFVAILALCLVAVSSLVEGYRASAPPEEVPAIVAPPIPARVGTGPGAAAPGPLPRPDRESLRRSPTDRRTLEPAAPVPPPADAASEPVPSPVEAPKDQAPGLSLRFLTDAALLRLVARGGAGVFVQSGSQTFALDLSDGIEFRKSQPPAQFYAMATETVPSVLRANYPGWGSGQWGVTLPLETARSIESFLAANATGELVIDSHGRVSLEKSDD